MNEHQGTANKSQGQGQVALKDREVVVLIGD